MSARHERSAVKAVDTSTSPEALPNNIEIVKTAQGTFRIIYGVHIIKQDPADLGSNFSGVVLETGTADYLTPEGLEKLLEMAQSHPIQRQLTDVMVRLAQEQRSIYLGDVADSEILVASLKVPLAVETLLAGAIGAAVLSTFSDARKKHAQAPLSRRELLKLAAAGTAAGVAEAYLTFPLVTGASTTAAMITGATLPKDAMRLQEEIHPELYALLVTLRNFIFASKLEAIKQHDQDASSAAELAIILGAGHTGVENALRMDPQVRAKAINEYLRYLPTIDREKLTKIVRLDYDRQAAKWQTTETFDDPKLK